MKSFLQIREAAAKHPGGEMVFNKKVLGSTVMIHKEKNVFVVYIDGEKLDSYKSQDQAEKAGKEFAKQYKGLK